MNLYRAKETGDPCWTYFVAVDMTSCIAMANKNSADVDIVELVQCRIEVESE